MQRVEKDSGALWCESEGERGAIGVTLFGLRIFVWLDGRLGGAGGERFVRKDNF
jgi:hypothetical protein